MVWVFGSSFPVLFCRTCIVFHFHSAFLPFLLLTCVSLVSRCCVSKPVFSPHSSLVCLSCLPLMLYWFVSVSWVFFVVVFFFLSLLSLALLVECSCFVSHFFGVPLVMDLRDYSSGCIKACFSFVCFNCLPFWSLSLSDSLLLDLSVQTMILRIWFTH